MSWDKLSMSDRADIIKLAVQSGIKDLYAIRDTYNEFAEGGEIESPVENSNIYAGGSYLDIAKQHIKKNEDWLAKPYRDAPKGKNWRSVGYGFNDSGFRNKYPQGISKHYENGITEAQAEEELNWFLGGVVNHLKKVYGRKWDSFNDNQKAAVIDTYYQRPASVVGKGSRFYKAVMAGDKNAGNYLGVAGYSTRNKDRRKLFGASQTESVTPTQGASIAAPIPSTTNSDESYNFLEVPQLTSLPPTAYTLGSLPTVEDIARQSALEPLTPEELRRQERHEKLERFQNVMGLMSRIQPSVQSSHLGNIASVLGQQSSAQYFSDGGSIHIKPENRGKFTALKERTGHSASWFKENGTPAQKKMAIFALNARKWKHGLGGNLFDGGGDLAPIIPFNQREEVIVTPDFEYNQYLNSLPDNQRFTPNDKYDSYLYWKLNGRPKNFEEAYNKEMFTYDNSDNSYHAHTIAWDDNTGIGHFMKPKDHDTVGYELDWFNKGLVTEEGGHQRPETPEEKAESDVFRNNYILMDDPDRPNFYKYQPKKHGLGGNLLGMGGSNPFTVGATIDSLYASSPKEEFLGEPDHHYDFTQSEEWADAHGYYLDARGHRDDRVKKPAHPSHPSRGTWNGNTFMLSDLGMQNPNYTLFGLNDGGQDPQATLTYKGGVVLPEITVTPKENYVFNPYDNIILHQKTLGGNLYEFGGDGGNNPRIITTGGAGYVPPVQSENAIDGALSTVSKKAMNYIKGVHDTGSYFNYDPSMEAYTGPAQDTYLLPRKLQEKEFLRRGYIKGKDKDYGLVKRGVGNRDLPVYQRNPDAITRDNLIVIGNIDGWDPWYGSADTALEHPGSYPTAIYTDGEGNFYQKGWDLNDYGGKTGSTIGVLSDIVDMVGSPTVVTTGYQSVKNPQSERFIQEITPMMAKKGLVPTDVNGRTEWTLPEVTVTGRKKRKKKALGGNLFDDGGKKSTPFTVIGDGQLNPDLVYDNFTIGGKPITLLSADYNTNTGVVRYEDGKEEKIMLAPNFWLNPKSSGSKKLPKQSDLFEGITNQAANEKADEFANRTSLTPERFIGLTAASVPLAAGALGAVVAAPVVGNALMGSVINPVSDYIGGTAVGQMITRGLSNPYVSKGIEAAFAGHGLNHAINEGIDGWGDAATTALELTPLASLAKPVYKGVVQPGMTLFNSPLTGKWADVMAEPSKITTAYRTPAASQITAENAASITPELDAAYKEAVESGNRPEALRLLEQAYLNSGVPKTEVTVTPEGNAVGWFHGSERGNHTVFDSRAMNATIGGASANGRVKGNFLTTDVPSGMRYAGSSRYESANVPEYTSPQTFSEKLKNLFGAYTPRRLYPAERVGEYAPKPERLFDTKGMAPIKHLDKVDQVVYPLYVNPGENMMSLDFQGKPWSQAPVKFPNSYVLERKIHTPEKDWINAYGDPVLEYKTEKVPYKTLEEAIEAFTKDPIAKVRPENPLLSLQNQKFDAYDMTRAIEGFNSRPHYETVRLIESYTPSTTNGAVQTAAREGNSSVLMRNVIDSNGGPNGEHYAIDDFVTLKPNQQKLADITYDDNGDLIPLSQRFNWSKDDSRWSWLLPIFGIGAGTAAVEE